MLPPTTVTDVLARERVVTPRVRRLDLVCTLLLLIAMHLEPRMRLRDVLRTLLHTARLQQEVPDPVPGDSAICYRRQQLGGRPLVALYHQVAQPLATPRTPGAFLGAYRLVTLDGTTFALPDTPALRRTYGSSANQHGAGSYPHLRAVLLVECGTHAILDAGCWPYAVGEPTGAHRLVRSLTPDMLVLLDCGLHSYDLLTAIQAQGAHVLGRIASNRTVQKQTVLPDGSWLVDLWPPDQGGSRHLPPLRLRLIEYTIDDPQADGQVYRVLTTLLDADAYPAHTLAVTYHERWEGESTLDEVKTHLDLPQQPFRSQTPLGVVQEFYGLVLAHYLVRALMHASAVEADLDPDRLSFVHAVRVLRRYLSDAQRLPLAAVAHLGRRLRAELREQWVPPRRDRANPRCVKRARSSFPMNRTRAPGRLRRPFAELIQLI